MTTVVKYNISLAITLQIRLLEEEKEEQLSEKVIILFEHLGERPHHESLRLGSTCDTGKYRPVKVKLPTPDHVHRILKQAKSLKQSPSYSSVFTAPGLEVRRKTEEE